MQRNVNFKSSKQAELVGRRLIKIKWTVTNQVNFPGNKNTQQSVKSTGRETKGKTVMLTGPRV